MYYEDIVYVELNRGTVCRSYINRAIGEGDDRGNRYGVRILKNGVKQSLAGTVCTGYFIRSDGVTLVISGSVEGTAEDSVAYVELPEAAYAVEGQFTLAIKLSGGNFSGTMRIVDGTVVNTTTGHISDPAAVVPDVSTLNALIAAAEAAAEPIENLEISATVISGTRHKITVTKGA